MNTVRKKAPNPVDQRVGSRVRVRRMMLAMSQTNLGSALDLPAQGTFSHYIPLQCMLPAKREQEMANEGLINLVAWCKRERESLQMQREMLQSGKFRIFKNEGSGQVDTSSDSIERITANITELDAILADYEARGFRA
jgi:hypothetical protein